jgi:hypothetical protein
MVFLICQVPILDAAAMMTPRKWLKVLFLFFWFESQAPCKHIVQQSPHHLSLLIIPPRQHIPPPLQNAAQVLIHRKRNGLARRHAHHPGRNALVETAGALLLPHVGRDVDDARDGGLAGLGGGFLQPGLDGVDGRVGEGAHGAGDEPDQRGLVGGEVGCALVGLQAGAEVGVGGEVC